MLWAQLAALIQSAPLVLGIWYLDDNLAIATCATARNILYWRNAPNVPNGGGSRLGELPRAVSPSTNRSVSHPVRVDN
jgi:hypothetical protein